MMNIYTEAQEKFDKKIGILFPCFMTHSNNPTLYGDDDLGKDCKFITRRAGSSSCWLIPREVVFECFDKQMLEDYQLHHILYHF